MPTRRVALAGYLLILAITIAIGLVLCAERALGTNSYHERGWCHAQVTTCYGINPSPTPPRLLGPAA
jgi:hypothetical protein